MNQNGSTLIAVLGSIAILGLLSVAVWASVEQRSASYASGRYASQRSSLALRLRREARAGLNLYASLKPAYRIANDPLYRCLLEHATDPASDCAAGVWYPLTLVSDDDQLLAGASASYPASYNSSGGSCAGRSCLFKVWAEFQASCESGAATCSVAKSLNVRLHIVTGASGSSITISEKIFTEYVPIADAQFGTASYIGFDLKALPAAPPSGSGSGSEVILSSSSGSLTDPAASVGGGVSIPAPRPPPPPTFISCPFGQITGGGSCGSYFL